MTKCAILLAFLISALTVSPLAHGFGDLAVERSEATVFRISPLMALDEGAYWLVVGYTMEWSAVAAMRDDEARNLTPDGSVDRVRIEASLRAALVQAYRARMAGRIKA